MSLRLAHYLFIASCSLLLLGACGGASEPKDYVTNPSESLSEFADGSRAKVVWARATGDNHSDTFVEKPIHQLWKLDSDVGEEQLLIEDLGNYRRPLITPDGEGVVYSDHLTNRMHFIQWKGSGRKNLGTGIALDVWEDPKTGKTWIYFAPNSELSTGQTKAPSVSRFPLDKPEAREPVWNSSEVGLDNFHVSKDGKTFTALFPWPQAGVADIAAGTWKKVLRGCWPSQAPDGSGVVWVFDGPHQNVNFFAQSPKDQSWKSWKVSVSDHPDLEGHETYHPRFGNHPRLFSVTGPYLHTPDEGGPHILAGGASVEIFLGRFAPDLGKVEEWWQITDNQSGDFYPDVWVENGDKAKLDLGLVTKNKDEGLPSHALSKTDWPCSTKRLLFAWNNGLVQNQVTLEKADKPTSCEISLEGMAFFGRDYDLVLDGGQARTDTATARRFLDMLRERRQGTIQFAVLNGQFNNPGLQPIVRLGTKESGDIVTIGQIEGHIYLLSPALGIHEPLKGPHLNWNEKTFVSANLKEQSGTVLFGNGTISADVHVAKMTLPGPDEEPYLIFGGTSSAGIYWDGQLEKISLFGRKLNPSEIDSQNDTIFNEISARPKVETIELKAKLVATQPVPSVDSLGAYTRAMVVYTYDVTEVIRGKLDAKRIQVAHWAVVNRTALGTFPRGVGGNDTWLMIEPFEAHPQLSSERISEYGFDAPLYYDVTVPLMNWK